MSENRCVCCGEIIPEGVQVCKQCVHDYMEQERKARFNAVAKTKAGKEFLNSGTISEMTVWADKMMQTQDISEISIRRRT